MSTAPDLEDFIPAIMEGMLEKFVSGTGVWLQPLTFPNPEKKFHYYMMVKPKGPDVLCLRHGADAIVTESLETEALRNELMATAQSNGVKVNSDLRDFKNIEDDRVRALFTAALGDAAPEAAGGDGFNEDASRELFEACERGTSGHFDDFKSVGAQIAEFRRLLDLGADPCFGDEYECTFSKVCFNGSLATITFFLESGKVNVNWAADYNQTTALHEVCRCKDSKVAAVVRLLLAAGANPLAKNSNGYTALHCIAEDCGCLEAEFAAVALIEAGCDPMEIAPNAVCGDKTAVDMAEEIDTDGYGDEAVTFKTNMLSALKDDPKGSSRAKYQAWCVAEAQRAAELKEWKENKLKGMGGKEVSICSVGYSGGGNDYEFHLKDSDGNEYPKGKEYVLGVKFVEEADEEGGEAQQKWPATLTSTGVTIPWLFTKSVWNNFFKREHNFSEECQVWTVDDDFFYCKMTNAVLCEKEGMSGYAGENKWAGVVIKIPVKKE